MRNHTLTLVETSYRLRVLAVVTALVLIAVVTVPVNVLGTAVAQTGTDDRAAIAADESSPPPSILNTPWG